MKNNHETFGKISISKYSGRGEFFGSDLVHNGGINIEISGASVERKVGREWIHSENLKIRVQMSHNQYIDMITSGMNTDGVPCTIIHDGTKFLDRIPHAKNTKEDFKRDFNKTNEQLLLRIEELQSKLSGNIGKRKLEELKHDLSIIKNHLESNIPFVMNSFTEEMEQVVTEAKHSISNYMEHKVRTLGLEAIKGDVVKITE